MRAVKLDFCQTPRPFRVTVKVEGRVDLFHHIGADFNGKATDLEAEIYDFVRKQGIREPVDLFKLIPSEPDQRFEAAEDEVLSTTFPKKPAQVQVRYSRVWVRYVIKDTEKSGQIEMHLYQTVRHFVSAVLKENGIEISARCAVSIPGPEKHQRHRLSSEATFSTIDGIFMDGGQRVLDQVRVTVGSRA